MTKVVKNNCYGGFGLSPEAQIEYLRRKRGEAHAYERVSEIGEDPRRYEKIELSEYRDDFDKAVTHVDQGDYVEGELEGYFFDHSVDRDDPVLVEIIEEMGKAASGLYAELQVVEIPDDVDWRISEYDGLETVEEAHRTW